MKTYVQHPIVNGMRERAMLILQQAGFRNSDYDPFEFNARIPHNLTVNGIVFSNVTSVYVGEESMTIDGKASVPLNRITEMHAGGIRR